MYGMQWRGVSKLRDLEHNEFRSAGVEDFATEMQELENLFKIERNMVFLKEYVFVYFLF
jgi:hypothetical protein